MVQPQRPMYRQVADLIRAAIESGEFARGATLPSEPRLAERYGTTRDVVNDAITRLRAEGLVRTTRGKGNYVSPIPRLTRDASTRYSYAVRERHNSRGPFDGEVRSHGLIPRSDLVDVSPVIPPARVAQTLGLPEGEPNTLHRRRYMYANDVPVMIAISYIPMDIAEGTALADEDPGPGGIISRFADLGHPQRLITEDITIRWAKDTEEQSFLGLLDDQPVIENFHVASDHEGRPVEVNVMVMPAHQWALHYEWDQLD